jgi:hypothetical protein
MTFKLNLSQLDRYIYNCKDFRLKVNNEEHAGYYVSQFDESQFFVGDYVMVDTMFGLRLGKIEKALFNSFNVGIIPPAKTKHEEIYDEAVIGEDEILCLMLKIMT